MNLPLSKRYKDPLVTLNIKSTSENTHGNVVICPTPMGEFNFDCISSSIKGYLSTLDILFDEILTSIRLRIAFIFGVQTL